LAIVDSGGAPVGACAGRAYDALSHGLIICMVVGVVRTAAAIVPRVGNHWTRAADATVWISAIEAIATHAANPVRRRNIHRVARETGSESRGGSMEVVLAVDADVVVRSAGPVPAGLGAVLPRWTGVASEEVATDLPDRTWFALPSCHASEANQRLRASQDASGVARYCIESRLTRCASCSSISC